MKYVTSINVSLSSIKLEVGDWGVATATVLPNDATKKFVKWSSDNTAVASVNETTGDIQAVGIGSARIIATATDGSNVTGSCTVAVVPATVLVSSISLNKTNMVLNEGEYDSILATVLPENATNRNVEWTSDDETIATVTWGTVSGIKVGTTTVRATATDGSGVTVACSVSVEPLLVNSITLSQTRMDITVGNSASIDFEISPSDATNTAVECTSSNSSIVEIIDKTISSCGCGRITFKAKAAGSAIITVAATDGSGVKGHCEVTVNVPVVENTVPGLRTIKQCRVRKDMSMDDSAILRDSSGTSVKLNVGDTVPLLSPTNNSEWYRILYNGMMLYVTNDGSFEEIDVPSPSIPEGRDIFANPGLDSNINIRSTPFEAAGNIIGQFAHGTNLTLTCNAPQNSEWFAVYGKNKNGTYSYGWYSGRYLAYYFLNTIRDCYVRTSMVINSSTILKDSSGKSVVLREDTVDSVRLWKLDKLTGGEYSDHNGKIRNDWYMVEYNGQIAYVTADSFYISNFGEPLIDESQDDNDPTGGNSDERPVHASDRCLEFIIDYEGKEFWATARDDGYGNLTIGYGHVVKSGESFGTITQEEALQLFSQDISSFEHMVINYSNNRNVVWNQHQFDAFVSLTFNAGINVAGVMDDIIAGIDPYTAFSKVSNVNGKPSLGVWRRRMDEADIFVHGTYTIEERQMPVG